LVSTNNITLEQYWAEYALGKNDLMTMLYSQYKLPLLMVAYKYLRCEKSSEDIVADTFEKLIVMSTKDRQQLIETLKINPIAYLSIIVKNKSLDALRKTKNRYRILDSVKQLVTTEVDNEAYVKFLDEGLELMLAKLEPREKEIIQLHINGFSNDEISEKLNLKYNTVKNNIYEAKLKLRCIWKCAM
jgi:RNA polymerase sigma-70 factor (ECF subfamily)